MCRWGSLQSGPGTVNVMIYHSHLLGCIRTESEADPLWCEVLASLRVQRSQPKAATQLVGVSQFCLGSPCGEIKQRWQLLPVTVLNAEKDSFSPHDNQSFSLLQLGKRRLSGQDWTARKGGAGFTFRWSKPRAKTPGLCTLQLSCSFFARFISFIIHFRIHSDSRKSQTLQRWALLLIQLLST